MNHDKHLVYKYTYSCWSRGAYNITYHRVDVDRVGYDMTHVAHIHSPRKPFNVQLKRNHWYTFAIWISFSAISTWRHFSFQQSPEIKRDNSDKYGRICIYSNICGSLFKLIQFCLFDKIVQIGGRISSWISRLSDGKFKKKITINQPYCDSTINKIKITRCFFSNTKWKHGQI